MSITNAFSALSQAFLAGNFFPSSDVEYENLAFNPPSNRPWASFHFQPSQPSLATLGSNGTDELTGFVQVDLNYPRNKAVGAQWAKAEAIKSLFKAGSRVSYSGTEVKIISAGFGAGREVNGYHRISVTIYFETRINR